MIVGVLAAVLPWFLPGLAATAVIAVAVSGVVARHLDTARWNAVLLVMSVGAVLVATLPPEGDGLLSDEPAVVGTCDLGRFWPARPAEYASLVDSALNVLLFAPLGLAIGLLRPSGPQGQSNRPVRARIVAAAAVSPLVIEATQALVPVLGRGCQSQDVVDNLLGLGLGLGLGLAVGATSVVGPRRAARVRRRS